MIRYIIMNNNNKVDERYYSTPDIKTPFTSNANLCIGYSDLNAGIRMTTFLNDELSPDEQSFFITDHTIIEVQNRYENIQLGYTPGYPFMTVGDRYHFIGIPEREYDINVLRGGDGC